MPVAASKRLLGYAISVVSVYGLGFLALTVPVAALCGARWPGHKPQSMGFHLSARDALEFYQSVPYWIYWGTLLAVLGMLLFVPLWQATSRSLHRWHMWVPTAGLAFALANAVLAGGFSLLCVLFEENAYQGLEALVKALTNNPLTRAVFGPGVISSIGDDWAHLFTLFCLLAIFAGVLGWIFFVRAKADHPAGFMDRAEKWLRWGSVSELLLAGASHGRVRWRDDCCTPIATFFGVSLGLSLCMMCLALAHCLKRFREAMITRDENSTGF